MNQRFTLENFLPLIIAGGLMSCDNTLDFDLRSNLGGILDTSEAVLNASSTLPAPDARGVIKFVSYQVVIAKHGDRIADVANRIGADANMLARYNGITPDAILRNGEIIALPRDFLIINSSGASVEPVVVSVSELEDITTSRATSGLEPVRHKVKDGETAASVAGLYDASTEILSSWNSLDEQNNVRTGQFLLVPTNMDKTKTVSGPGEGSNIPLPPSSKNSKPQNETKLKPQEDEMPRNDSKTSDTLVNQETLDLDQETIFVRPTKGNIIRSYKKGSNDGIDIGAKAGSDVLSADKGIVAAITKDTNGVSILVIKHTDGLLTVYTNIDNLMVKKGDPVARGQKIAKVNKGSPEFLHFEVRKGLESVDPEDFI